MSIYNQGNTEDFIRKANQVHNRKYSYEYSIYKNSKTKLIINCPIHGNFEQIPSHHIGLVYGEGVEKALNETPVGDSAMFL